MLHAFFDTLPMGTPFLHQGTRYKKTGEEEAVELSTGKRWVFEIHYGCFVSKSLKGVVTERPL